MWSRILSAIAAGVAVPSCPIPASATTLVAWWTPQRLLIAADSRVVDDARRTLNDQACKIVQSGSLFYASSGLVEDREAGLSVAAAVQASAAVGDSAAVRLEAFLTVVRPPLERALAGFRRLDPAAFQTLSAQKRPVLQVIFAQARSGAPVLAIGGFQLNPQGALAEVRQVVADGSDPRGPRLIYAGQQRNLREYLAGHREWPSQDGAALVETLVQAEIAAGTAEVGGPVDVLSIEPGRVEWLRHKSGCPAIERPGT
jgi:hypothetical protein